MLGKLLLCPLTGPLKLLLATGKKVQELVDQELLNDPAAIKQRLLELQMQLEWGQISADEYARRERALLKHLEQLRAPEQQSRPGPAAAERSERP